MRTASFLLLLLFSISSAASLKDIRPDKLPPNAPVQGAYQEVLKLEPMVFRWTDKWNFETPQADVAKQLAADLSVLQQQANATPDNVELWLLVSTVARYAYNLDVPNAHEAIVAASEKAATLAPSDVRAPWFRAIHECQTTALVNHGMQALLDIESSSTAKHLPASFWDDYMECATTANMPAHVLRASEQRQSLDTDVPWFQQELIKIAQRRFDTYDKAKTYGPRETWLLKQDKSYPVFSSDLFGFSFAAKADWPLDLKCPQDSQCFVTMEAGPFKGKAGDVFPSIVVVARPAKPSESLQDFLRGYMHYKNARIVAAPCPATDCVTSETIAPDIYPEQGGGRAVMTAFQRIEPKQSGLLWEEPNSPPVQNENPTTPSYFRPNQRLKRLSGTIYYLIMLDTAESVYPEAKTAYDAFLKSMRVE